MISEEYLDKVSGLAKTTLDGPNPDEFASYLALNTLAHLDCTGVIVGVIRRTGFIDIVGSFGYQDEIIQQFNRIPLWRSLPITEAVKFSRITIFQSTKDVVDKYPDLQGMFPEKGITISAPLTHRNISIGAVRFAVNKHPSKEFTSSAGTIAILSLIGIYVRNYLDNLNNAPSKYLDNSKSLTSRQTEIIELFRYNLTTDQIAKTLNFSSSTIKQEIMKLYSIFGVNNRNEVIEFAIQAGIISPNQSITPPHRLS
jgi:DNA-binding CsgD family transcriptional regulator